MLRTPMYLQPVRDSGGLHELRDNGGRVVAANITALEGSEAVVRCNAHIALVYAVKVARALPLLDAATRAALDAGLAAAGEQL